MNVKPHIITGNIPECAERKSIGVSQEAITPAEKTITIIGKESGNSNNPIQRDYLHHHGQLLRELGCCIDSWAPLA
jgi:hypothetical protein